MKHSMRAKSLQILSNTFKNYIPTKLHTIAKANKIPSVQSS